MAGRERVELRFQRIADPDAIREASREAEGVARLLGRRQGEAIERWLREHDADPDRQEIAIHADLASGRAEMVVVLVPKDAGFAWHTRDDLLRAAAVYPTLVLSTAIVLEPRA